MIIYFHSCAQIRKQVAWLQRLRSIRIVLMIQRYPFIKSRNSLLMARKCCFMHYMEMKLMKNFVSLLWFRDVFFRSIGFLQRSKTAFLFKSCLFLFHQVLLINEEKIPDTENWLQSTFSARSNSSIYFLLLRPLIMICLWWTCSTVE